MYFNTFLHINDTLILNMLLYEYSQIIIQYVIGYEEHHVQSDLKGGLKYNIRNSPVLINSYMCIDAFLTLASCLIRVYTLIACGETHSVQ